VPPFLASRSPQCRHGSFLLQDFCPSMRWRLLMATISLCTRRHDIVHGYSLSPMSHSTAGTESYQPTQIRELFLFRLRGFRTFHVPNGKALIKLRCLAGLPGSYKNGLQLYNLLKWLVPFNQRSNPLSAAGRFSTPPSSFHISSISAQCTSNFYRSSYCLLLCLGFLALLSTNITIAVKLKEG
jgi:hypothetical protein